MTVTLPKGAAAIRKTLEKVASQELSKLDKSTPDPGKPPQMWSARLSPPMFDNWPAHGDGIVHYYAYAAMLRPGLSDGEVVSAPFAHLIVDMRAGKAGVKTLGPLKELGIQGVHPASKTDVALWKTRDAAEERVLKTSLSKSDEPDPTVCGFYCMWLRNNGVIGSELRKKHPAFFTALNCK